MLSRINKKIIAFQSTVYYPLLIASVVFLCHTFSLDAAGFCIMVALIIYTLIVSEDTLKIISPIILGIFIISKKNSPYQGNSTYYSETFNLVLLAVLGALLAGALIYRWIRSGRRSFRNIGLLYGLMALSAAYFLGGIFYKNYSAGSLVIAALFSTLTLGLLYFFATTVKWDKDSFDYICNIMSVAVSLIVCQMIYLYASNDELRKTFNKGQIVLGWGISNIIAATITIMLPFVLYQTATKKNCILYFAIATAGLFAVVYTLSRTSLSCCALCYFAVGVYNIIRGKNKLLLRLSYGVVTVIVAVAFVAFYDDIIFSLNFFIEKGIDDSGRFELYELGLRNWRKNPIFGTGLQYTNENFPLNFWYLRYHNHLVHFLASTGIVGLLAYLFHRFQTLWLIFRKPTKQKMFLFLSVLMIIYTSFFDVALFNPTALMLYAVVLISLEMLACRHNSDETVSSSEQQSKIPSV